MAINFEYYKVFYYVAKYKKISTAAEKLYISQPAVTQTIKKLEEQMGGNLLIRIPKGVELSETGKMLYELINESVEVLDNAEYMFSKYKNLEEGTIRIRSGGNATKRILYNALEKFGTDYPNLKVKIETGAVKESIKLLETGKIDMVVTHYPIDIEYNNLQVVECGKKEYIFVMSKKYAEDNKVNIKKLEDFNKYSLIVPKINSAMGNIFEKKFKDKITNYHYEITSEQIKKELIMKNMGIGFLIKDEIKEELEDGEAIEIKLKDLNCDISFCVITLKNDLLGFATKKLIEYIK